MTRRGPDVVDEATMAMLESLTLERLLKHIEPRGSCMVWTGYCNGDNPQVRLGGGKGQAFGVRRTLYLLTRGPDSILCGHQIGLVSRCRSELCVHPDHLVSRSRSKAQRGAAISLAHKIRIAASKRAQSKLAMDTVRAIRAGDERSSVLDARFGLPAGYSSKIRRGLVWVDYASPFATLERRS